MGNIEFWKQHYRHQIISGWCGPAVVQMVLSSAGIEKSQKAIARYIYKSWWGTPHQLILAYLSKYFKTVNYKNSATLKDVRFHLNKANILVVNWWDNIDDENNGDGHYSILADYSEKKVTLVDSDISRGIWSLPSDDFKRRWYDYIDTRNTTYVEGWMLWVDPKSKI
jgi:hypothetical protein